MSIHFNNPLSCCLEANPLSKFALILFRCNYDAKNHNALSVWFHIEIIEFFRCAVRYSMFSGSKEKTNVIKSATPWRDKWQINIIYGIKSFNYGTVAFRYGYCSNCLHVGPLKNIPFVFSALDKLSWMLKAQRRPLWKLRCLSLWTILKAPKQQ